MKNENENDDNDDTNQEKDNNIYIWCPSCLGKRYRINSFGKQIPCLLCESEGKVKKCKCGIPIPLNDEICMICALNKSKNISTDPIFKDEPWFSYIFT